MDLVTRLSFLFGTEEAVNRRRQLVLLREKVDHLKKLSARYSDCSESYMISSGSLGEGVRYPPSDDDIMETCRKPSVLVYQSYEEAIQNRALYMTPSVYSPGFCVILGTNEHGHVHVVSSKAFREWCIQSRPDCVEHGPCASKTNGPFEYDYAKCFSCSSWPSMASEWIGRRRRYEWPPHELIEAITMEGCHFVPIGNPSSPLRDVEWRVSFSLAERSLIHNFNHVQFLVYNLLKLILKKVIGIIIPNVLCSYFIKTVMFFVIENTSSTLWINNNLEECYTKSLFLLYHFIHKMECPNYFIPSNNMMRRKVNTNNRAPLLYIIQELMALGILGSLRHCDVDEVVLSPNLSLASVEFKQDYEACHGYLLDVVQFDLIGYIEENTTQQNVPLSLRTILVPIISSFQNLSGSIMSLLLRHIFLQMGLQCIQISQHALEGNKSRYQMMQQGQGLLTKGCYTDISSGRLQLASYMFMTGRFNCALDMIKTVLSKIAPYVMSQGSQHTAKDLYMEILCNKHYSLIHKLRKGWALDFKASLICVDTSPTPIRIMASMTGLRICILPRVYAYFLQGLCFHQSRDTFSMNISVRSLEDTVRALHPCCCVHQMFYGRILLGYLKMLQQDYCTSCRYFVAAYLMKEEVRKDEKYYYPSVADSPPIFLACLFNRVCNRNA